MEMLVDYYNGGVSGYNKAVTDLIIEKYDKIRDDPRELDYSLTQEKRLYYISMGQGWLMNWQLSNWKEYKDVSGNFIGAQPYIQFGLELAKALNWIRHDVLNDVLELAIHNLQIDSPEKPAGKPPNYTGFWKVNIKYLNLSVFCNWKFANLIKLLLL